MVGRWLTQQSSTVCFELISFLFYCVHGCSHMQHVEHKLFQEAFTSDSQLHYLQGLAFVGDCCDKLQSLEFMWTRQACTIIVLFSKGCFSVECLLSLVWRHRVIHIYGCRTHCLCGVMREQITVETMNRGVLSHSTLLTGLVPVKLDQIWLSQRSLLIQTMLQVWHLQMIPVWLYGMWRCYQFFMS